MNIMTSEPFDETDDVALTAAMSWAARRIMGAGLPAGDFQFRYESRGDGRGVVQARPGRLLKRSERAAWTKLTATPTHTTDSMIIDHESPAIRPATFTLTDEPDGTLVVIDGDLIVGNRQRLKEIIEEHAKARQARNGKAGRYILDFSDTGYIDSSGLGVLFALQMKRLPQYGAHLELVNLNDDLKMLFELTKLTDHFAIEGRRSPLQRVK